MLRSIILIFDLDGGVTRMRKTQDDRLHVPVKIDYENGSSSPFFSRVAACISDFSRLSERIQRLAQALISQNSPGLIYPSVRHRDHTCIVCFRPAMVYNPRRDLRVEVALFATEDGYQVQSRAVEIQ